MPQVFAVVRLKACLSGFLKTTRPPLFSVGWHDTRIRVRRPDRRPSSSPDMANIKLLKPRQIETLGVGTHADEGRSRA